MVAAAALPPGTAALATIRAAVDGHCGELAGRHVALPCPMRGPHHRSRYRRHCSGLAASALTPPPGSRRTLAAASCCLVSKSCCYPATRFAIPATVARRAARFGRSPCYRLPCPWP
eukprot:12126473-Alexandrium_andersonii.AAC.1